MGIISSRPFFYDFRIPFLESFQMAVSRPLSHPEQRCRYENDLRRGEDRGVEVNGTVVTEEVWEESWERNRDTKAGLYLAAGNRILESSSPLVH